MSPPTPPPPGAIARARGGDPEGSTAQLEELAGLPPGWIGELAATLYGFHFARESMLREHLLATPAWILEFQRMS